MAREFDNGMHYQIDIVLMIAMAAKNAILLAGAARKRFLPIMMTSIAFILGMLPLASAQGAGAVGQRVLGGMILATLYHNLFVPPFYAVLQGFSEWLGRGKGGEADAAAPRATPPRAQAAMATTCQPEASG